MGERGTGGFLAILLQHSLIEDAMRPVVARIANHALQGPPGKLNPPGSRVGIGTGLAG